MQFANLWLTGRNECLNMLVANLFSGISPDLHAMVVIMH